MARPHSIIPRTSDPRPANDYRRRILGVAGVMMSLTRSVSRRMMEIERDGRGNATLPARNQCVVVVLGGVAWWVLTRTSSTLYATFYGLDELPFELSPDPKYLLLTARHREALANLEYGIAASKSLTLLLGPAGTGKTTLIQAALQSEACRGARIVHLVNPMLTRKEFVEFLARSFDLSPGAMGSKATLLAELERELLAGADQGRTTALVIDEAQCLSGELLEEIRLLSNIETPGRKLLPLVLAGQPELSDRLRLPSLVQLKQRVALRCTLGLLDAAETRAYITSRLKVAGANGHEIFTPDALQAIYERSGGVPRTISAICDNALVNGFAAEATVVGVDIIREVCDDFDLSVPFSESAETTRPRPVLAETKAPPIAFRLVSPTEIQRGVGVRHAVATTGRGGHRPTGRTGS